jgi:hypothetical protein
VQGYVVTENTVNISGIPYTPGQTFGQASSAYIITITIPVPCLTDLVGAGANIYLLLYGNQNTQPVVIQVPLVQQKPLINVMCSGASGQPGPSITVSGAIVIGTKLKVKIAVDVLEQNLGNAPALTSINASITFPNGQSYSATQYCMYYASDTGSAPEPCSSPIQISPGTSSEYIVEIDILPILQNNPQLYQYMAVNSTLYITLNFIMPNNVSLASCSVPAYVGTCAVGLFGYQQIYVPSLACPIHWRHPVCFVSTGSEVGGVPVLSPGQNATVVCYLTQAEFATDTLIYPVELPQTVLNQVTAYTQLNDLALTLAGQQSLTPIKIPANQLVSGVKVASFPITASTTPGVHYVAVGFVAVPVGVITSSAAIKALSAPSYTLAPTTYGYLLDVAYAYYIVQSSSATSCPSPGQILINPASLSLSLSPGQSQGVTYYVLNNSQYDLTMQCSYQDPFTTQVISLGTISLPHNGQASVSFTINVPTNAQPGTYKLSVTCALTNPNTNTSCGQAPSFTATISVLTTVPTITVNCNFAGGTLYLAPSCTTTLQCTATNNSAQAITLYPALYDSLGNLIIAGTPVSIPPGQSSTLSITFTTPNVITTATYEIGVFTTTPPNSLPSCSPSQSLIYCATFMVSTSTGATCPTQVAVSAPTTAAININQLLTAVLAIGIMGALMFALLEITRRMRQQT